MNAPPDVLHVVRQWVQRAEEDMRTAQHILTMRRDCPYGTACFHAQQATEKYVKALLTSLSIDFPKTHDIGELLALLPPTVALPQSDIQQETLTRYATVTRYPGDWAPITRREAEEAVQAAEMIRDAVRGELPKEGIRIRPSAVKRRAVLTKTASSPSRSRKRKRRNPRKSR